jgi:hypothetical protein
MPRQIKIVFEDGTYSRVDTEYVSHFCRRVNALKRDRESGEHDVMRLINREVELWIKYSPLFGLCMVETTKPKRKWKELVKDAQRDFLNLCDGMPQ